MEMSSCAATGWKTYCFLAEDFHGDCATVTIFFFAVLCKLLLEGNRWNKNILLLWRVYSDECKIAWTIFFPFYQERLI